MILCMISLMNKYKTKSASTSNLSNFVTHKTFFFLSPTRLLKTGTHYQLLWWTRTQAVALSLASHVWGRRLTNAPLPQKPVAGRKLVGKQSFHFQPISLDIGQTHFDLSHKDGAGTLLAGVWSEQPVGNLIVTRHWWDTGRTFSSGLHRSSSE